MSGSSTSCLVLLNQDSERLRIPCRSISLVDIPAPRIVEGVTIGSYIVARRDRDTLAIEDEIVSGKGCSTSTVHLLRTGS